MSTAVEDMNEKISALVKNLTGDEIVGIGVGLVARGVFRGATNNGIDAAITCAQAASSAASSIHIDMRKRQSREAKAGTV